MKEFSRDQLLDDLIGPEAFASGSDLQTVINGIRSEKVRRRRRVINTIAVAGLLIGALIGFRFMVSFQIGQTATAFVSLQPPADQPASNRPDFLVKRIDDAELLSLLEGQPLALVRLEGDQRRLLMIVDN